MLGYICSIGPGSGAAPLLGTERLLPARVASVDLRGRLLPRLCCGRVRRLHMRDLQRIRLRRESSGQRSRKQLPLPHCGRGERPAARDSQALVPAETGTSTARRGAISALQAESGRRDGSGLQRLACISPPPTHRLTRGNVRAGHQRTRLQGHLSYLAAQSAQRLLAAERRRPVSAMAAVVVARYMWKLHSSPLSHGQIPLLFSLPPSQRRAIVARSWM